MALPMGQLQEPFTGSSAPAGWTEFLAGGATFTYDQTGAQVNFPAATTAITDGDVTTNTTYSLIGSFANLNVLAVPSAATSADGGFRLYIDANNWLRWVYEGGTLFAQYMVASVKSTPFSVAYDSNVHKFWQIREKGGVVFWETSATGQPDSWTFRASVANPITLTALTVLIAGVGTGVDANPGTYKFKYFNYPLPGTTSSTSSTSTSITSTSSTSTSISSTSASTSISSTSTSSTSTSLSTSSTSISMSITTNSTSSTSSSISSTSVSSTSISTSVSSTSSSISSTSASSVSTSSTSSSTSISSTSSSISSTSSSISSTSASISSTSASSTSSSTSTSTTTVPLNLDYTYQDTSPFTTTQKFIKTGAWVCPADVTSVIAECWGGGASGGANGSGQGGGGGGGAYAKTNAVTVVPGTSYTVTVGTGGAAKAPNGNGNNGNVSWFSTTGIAPVSTTEGALAQGGSGGANSAGSGAAGGAGGLASSSVGDITKNGGTGGSDAAGNDNGGGGGGAGGDKTVGGTGGASSASAGIGGASGATLGGRGGDGAGSAAAGLTGTAIGGGGGGAGGISFGPSGPGANGMVQLTYISAGLPTSSTDDIDLDTSKNYQNVAVDDGDYMVQYGSEYMIQEYKNKWTNNTDTPRFTYKGRSTMDTRISPFLVQIFNVNSSAWETLARVNTVSPDVDFNVVVSQSTNVSNYYDSNNTVTFRTYQQVI